ncbi:hypothetical protein HN682_01040 [Candidatus Peregrinibacteria bacterium]|nr:hypothetical protein [Candidatus Peregrinibacteria bacterium]
MTHIPGHNGTNNPISGGTQFGGFSQEFIDNLMEQFAQSGGIGEQPGQINPDFSGGQNIQSIFNPQPDTPFNFDNLLSILQGGDISSFLTSEFGFAKPDELTGFLPSEEPTLEKIGQAREGLQSGQQNLTNQFTQAFGQASSQQGQRNLAGAGRSFTDPLTEQFNTTSGNLNRGFNREKTNLQEDFLNKFLDRIADFYKFEAANG